MTFWKTNKAALKGGLNYLIKGVFQGLYSVTSEAPDLDHNVGEGVFSFIQTQGRSATSKINDEENGVLSDILVNNGALSHIATTARGATSKIDPSPTGVTSEIK